MQQGVERKSEEITSFSHLIKVHACAGAWFLTETQRKQALPRTPGAWPGKPGHGPEQEEAWAGGRHAASESCAFSQPLCSHTSSPSPGPSNSRGIWDRLWCSYSVWVAVTSMCPWPTKCRIKACHWPTSIMGPRGLRVSSLAHWGLPWACVFSL